MTPQNILILPNYTQAFFLQVLVQRPDGQKWDLKPYQDIIPELNLPEGAISGISSGRAAQFQKESLILGRFVRISGPDGYLILSTPAGRDSSNHLVFLTRILRINLNGLGDGRDTPVIASLDPSCLTLADEKSPEYPATEAQRVELMDAFTALNGLSSLPPAQNCEAIGTMLGDAMLHHELQILSSVPSPSADKKPIEGEAKNNDRVILSVLCVVMLALFLFVVIWHSHSKSQHKKGTLSAPPAAQTSAPASTGSSSDSSPFPSGEHPDLAMPDKETEKAEQDGESPPSSTENPSEAQSSSGQYPPAPPEASEPAETPRLAASAKDENQEGVAAKDPAVASVDTDLQKVPSSGQMPPVNAPAAAQAASEQQKAAEQDEEPNQTVKADQDRPPPQAPDQDQAQIVPPVKNASNLPSAAPPGSSDASAAFAAPLSAGNKSSAQASGASLNNSEAPPPASQSAEAPPATAGEDDSVSNSNVGTGQSPDADPVQEEDPQNTQDQPDTNEVIMPAGPKADSTVATSAPNPSPDSDNSSTTNPYSADYQSNGTAGSVLIDSGEVPTNPADGNGTSTNPAAPPPSEADGASVPGEKAYQSGNVEAGKAEQKAAGGSAAAKAKARASDYAAGVVAGNNQYE